jgi:virginiamycin B lyase
MLAACLFAATVPVLPAWAERGDITEFDLPEGSHMQALVAGPDGNLWLAGIQSCQPPCSPVAIIRLTPDGEATTFIAPRGSGDTPEHITLGPDGNLWVLEFEFSKLLRVTTAGEFTVFQLRATANSIAPGPDGNLWVAASSFPDRTARITRITVDGDVTEFPLEPGLSAGGITAGPDGRMWFAVSGQRIGMISMDGTIELLDVPFYPGSMVLGSDGNLWVAAFTGNTSLIVRFTPEREMTEFPIPLYVGLIVAGPDGALWGLSHREEVRLIVRITTEGELVEEFAVPQRPGYEGWPVGLAAGPDGNIWYATQGARVGRLEVGSATAAIRSVEPSGR